MQRLEQADHLLVDEVRPASEACDVGEDRVRFAPSEARSFGAEDVMVLGVSAPNTILSRRALSAAIERTPRSALIQAKLFPGPVLPI
jgi:hypothetical protein